MTVIYTIFLATLRVTDKRTALLASRRLGIGRGAPPKLSRPATLGNLNDCLCCLHSVIGNTVRSKDIYVTYGLAGAFARESHSNSGTGGAARRVIGCARGTESPANRNTALYYTHCQVHSLTLTFWCDNTISSVFQDHICTRKYISIHRRMVMRPILRFHLQFKGSNPNFLTVSFYVKHEYHRLTSNRVVSLGLTQFSK